MQRPVFEVLAAHHDRIGVTHVAVANPGDATVLDYYTLVARSVEHAILPRANKFPPDGVGVALLGRLAVDTGAQGQRIGTAMLLRAIKPLRALSASMRLWWMRSMSGRDSGI